MHLSRAGPWPDGCVAPIGFGGNARDLSAVRSLCCRRFSDAFLPAVVGALQASPSPLSEDQLADRFTGRGPWKKRLPQILDTLTALGRAQAVRATTAQGEGTAWRGS